MNRTETTGAVPARDRAAIMDLLVELTWALDTGDADRFEGVFAPDADFVLESGDTRLRVDGRDAVVADFRERRREPVVGTQHRVSNALFLADEDAVTVWSYWATSIRRPAGEVFLAGSGWMCDRFRPAGEGWRIEHHHVGGWPAPAHPGEGTPCC